MAVPDEGYRFVNWSGNVGSVVSLGNATTVAMNSDYSIIAKFEVLPPVQYGLGISAMAGGSITTPGEGRFTHDSGMVVDLVATSPSGHKFAGETGDVDVIANVNAASTNITLNSDYCICAHFRHMPCPSLN